MKKPTKPRPLSHAAQAALIKDDIYDFGQKKKFKKLIQELFSEGAVYKEGKIRRTCGKPKVTAEEAELADKYSISYNDGYTDGKSTGAMNTLNQVISLRKQLRQSQISELKANETACRLLREQFEVDELGPRSCQSRCLVCNDHFIIKRAGEIYCSLTCRHTAQKRRYRERKNQMKEKANVKL